MKPLKFIFVGGGYTVKLQIYRPMVDADEEVL